MIIKVYNLKRVNNRLVGYIKVSDFDFDKVMEEVDGKKKVKKVPNENFYRKFRKFTNLKWSPDFAWKQILDSEIKEITDNYSRKIEFYSRQMNHLLTLVNL